MQFSTQELEKMTMTVQDMFLNSGADSRIAHALKRLEYKTGAGFVGQLLTFRPEDLLRHHYIDSNRCMDIIEVLAYNGLRVAGLEDYKNELLHDVRASCPKLPEDLRGVPKSNVVDMAKVKATRGFASYLCDLEEKEIPMLTGKGWFSCYVANPAVRGKLQRAFMNSVVADSVPVGRVGLRLIDTQPAPQSQPRMA